jgi:hypothetical protein
VGIRTTLEVWDLDNHIYCNSFRGSNIAIKVIALPTPGKTGAALIEKNFFGYMFTGLNAAAILFDSTNGGCNKSTVRDNFFHVNTGAGYTGTIGVHTIGSNGLENHEFVGNNFQGYTAANSIGFNIYGKSIKLSGNTYAAFTHASAIAVNFASTTTGMVIEAEYFYGCTTAINGASTEGRVGPCTYSAVTTKTAFDSASAVDDYTHQSLTWTPGVTFGGAAVGMTLSTASAHYTEVRGLVTVWGKITLTAKGSSTGAARLTGLPRPVAVGTDAFRMGGIFTAYSNMSSLAGQPKLQAEANTTTMLINYDGAAASQAASQGNFTDTTAFNFIATYRTY